MPDAFLDEYRKNNRTFWLAVDEPQHTEVLGYRVSKNGEKLWEELDWSRWWTDFTSEGHLFSDPNCIYFHVPCRDGGDSEGCVYRVRCWYAGNKYRGWPVASVSLGFKNGKLHWILHCHKESTASSEPLTARPATSSTPASEREP